VPVVRLVAHFPARDGTPDGPRVVVWDGERQPGLVLLLRECARGLAPR
jgi:hypothetical protein